MIFYNVSFCPPQEKKQAALKQHEGELLNQKWIYFNQKYLFNMKGVEVYEERSNALLLLLQKDHNVPFPPSLILRCNFQQIHASFSIYL